MRRPLMKREKGPRPAAQLQGTHCRAVVQRDCVLCVHCDHTNPACRRSFLFV